MEKRLRIFNSDMDMLNMMDKTSAKSNVVVYIDYGANEIDLNLVEAPLTLSSTQHDEEVDPARNVAAQVWEAEHSREVKGLVDINIGAGGDEVTYEQRRRLKKRPIQKEVETDSGRSTDISLSDFNESDKEYDDLFEHRVNDSITKMEVYLGLQVVGRRDW